MSLIINGMNLPKHSAVNGEKDTAYRCVVLAHPDNTVELVIDTEIANPYDNGHNIQRYPLTELPTPHGRLVDSNELLDDFMKAYPVGSPELGCAFEIIESAEEFVKAEVNE